MALDRTHTNTINSALKLSNSRYSELVSCIIFLQFRLHSNIVVEHSLIKPWLVVTSECRQSSKLGFQPNVHWQLVNYKLC